MWKMVRARNLTSKESGWMSWGAQRAEQMLDEAFPETRDYAGRRSLMRGYNKEASNAQS